MRGTPNISWVERIRRILQSSKEEWTTDELGILLHIHGISDILRFANRLIEAGLLIKDRRLSYRQHWRIFYRLAVRRKL